MCVLFCPSGLRRGRTVTAQWLAQGRTKREAVTLTQVRHLIKLSLTLTPQQTQTDVWTNILSGSERSANVFCIWTDININAMYKEHSDFFFSTAGDSIRHMKAIEIKCLLHYYKASIVVQGHNGANFNYLRTFNPSSSQVTFVRLWFYGWMIDASCCILRGLFALSCAPFHPPS